MAAGAAAAGAGGAGAAGGAGGFDFKQLGGMLGGGGGGGGQQQQQQQGNWLIEAAKAQKDAFSGYLDAAAAAQPMNTQNIPMTTQQPNPSNPDFMQMSQYVDAAKQAAAIRANQNQTQQPQAEVPVEKKQQPTTVVEKAQQPTTVVVQQQPAQPPSPKVDPKTSESTIL